MNNQQPSTTGGVKGFLANIQALHFFYRFWLISALIIMVVVFVAFVPRIIFRPASITVVGEGEVDFTPTEVSMIVTSVTQDADPAAAIDNGDTVSQQLIDMAKNVGGETAEITKSFYQISPTAGTSGYEYQVVNAFSVKVKNPSLASDLVKAFYQAGAITVSNVTFSSSDDKQVALDARKEAVKDAKDQAKSIAKASGKFLGRMISISDDNQVAETTVSKASSTDELSPSTMSKAVSIIYELW